MLAKIPLTTRLTKSWVDPAEPVRTMPLAASPPDHRLTAHLPAIAVKLPPQLPLPPLLPLLPLLLLLPSRGRTATP